MIQEIGLHKVQCQDIMLGVDKLLSSEMADFVYSDPPWGQGNLRYWQTINHRHTGNEKRDIDYIAFFNQFFSILKKYLKDIAVIEYGERWRDDFIKLANIYGFKHHGYCTSLYKAGSDLLPVDVHLISKSGVHKMTDNFIKGCYELRGQKLVKHAFDCYCPKDAKIILDPMCGMGYTAQATIDKNLIFRGNELNAKRLDKTIARLEKSL